MCVWISMMGIVAVVGLSYGQLGEGRVLVFVFSISEERSTRIAERASSRAGMGSFEEC